MGRGSAGGAFSVEVRPGSARRGPPAPPPRPGGAQKSEKEVGFRGEKGFGWGRGRERPGLGAKWRISRHLAAWGHHGPNQIFQNGQPLGPRVDRDPLVVFARSKLWGISM